MTKLKPGGRVPLASIAFGCAMTAFVACGGGSGVNIGPATPNDSGSSAGDGGGSSSGNASSSGGPGGLGDGGSSGGAGGLHVVHGSGTTDGSIVDSKGNKVLLRGVDRSGTEYSCLYGNVFDGPSDLASVTAMKTWHVNAVRVPLNEDCWLNINGIPAASAGATYQAAIRSYVSLLESNGMIVILDLHWAAPGAEKANGQLGMADADHAPTFWTQVATAYAADDASVIFDLFNEPFITDWDCWLKGGACAQDYNKATYTAAGMATLLKAVRSAGADNVVIMGGLAYSSDFTHWVDHVNSIPTLAAPLDGLTVDNIAVSWHTYSDQSTQTLCPTQYNGYSTALSCATADVTATNYGIPAVLSAGFPIVAGEIGIGTYSSSIAPYTTTQAGQLTTWLEGMLTWMDSHGQGYLAWNWNVTAPPYLLTAFDGSPSPYFGDTYKAHVTKF